jgi:phosphatidylglycerol:prolipoprotein diacylglycerol transferase
MHPYLFNIPLPGGHCFPIRSYGLMIVLGFLVCLWLVQRRGKRMGLNPTALFDVAVVGLVGGIVGARLFYVIDNWNAFASDLTGIIRIDQGGLAFYGGLMGGAVVLLSGLWSKKLPVRPTLDVVASLVPLGHAFGRVGCFLNGCCFGKVTHSWVGVKFPRILNGAGDIVGSEPYLHQLRLGLIDKSQTWSLPVYPTQLFEVGYELLTFGILSFLLFRRRRAGDVAWLYAIFYGSARFVNEFFRADTQPSPALGGLTIFQVLSLGAATFGLVMLVDGIRRPAQPMPEPWQPPAAKARRHK